MSSGIRASDHDRDRTARLLREHHAVGRLDPDEFAERLDKSFQAKTVEELDRLTADLPAIDLYPLPTASLPKNRVVSTDLPAASVFRQSGSGLSGSGLAGSGFAGSGRFSPGWLAAWGSWSALFVIAFVLAALGIGWWPLLGMAAIGAVMGGRWVLGPGALGRDRDGRRQIGNLRPDEIDRGSDDA
ncbi:MAG TPA: DUF1707 domain-containing protein [Streptosporangiaceae bacterium]|nr:DUF1707 domain-containing protein [Streptosporangiaceae bacterium]